MFYHVIYFQPHFSGSPRYFSLAVPIYLLQRAYSQVSQTPVVGHSRLRVSVFSFTHLIQLSHGLFRNGPHKKLRSVGLFGTRPLSQAILVAGWGSLLSCSFSQWSYSATISQISHRVSAHVRPPFSWRLPLLSHKCGPDLPRPESRSTAITTLSISELVSPQAAPYSDFNIDWHTEHMLRSRQLTSLEPSPWTNLVCC